MKKTVFVSIITMILSQSIYATTLCSVATLDPVNPDPQNYTQPIVINKSVDENLLVPTILTTLSSDNLSVIYIADTSGQHISIINDSKTSIAGSSSNGTKVELHNAQLKIMIVCEKK